jgi:hypothetical protein
MWTWTQSVSWSWSCDDAEAHGWDSEVARHARVIASLQRHLDRLHQPAHPSAPA